MSLPAVGPLPGERRGYVDCANRQIHFRQQGEGPAVVLLHQAPWASIQFRRIMPLFAAAGCRAIAPDLPGHGMSDPLEEPTIQGFAAILPPLLGALGVSRAALVGHHGGALVAARMAAEFPDMAAALAMDNAPLYTPAQREKRLAGIDLTQQVASDSSHFTDRWARVRSIADPEWSAETIHIAVLTYFANGPTREHGHDAAARYDLDADLDRIACPTLVMSGQADPLFPCGKALIDRRPDWEYSAMQGGSGVLLEHPDIWFKTVFSFLTAQAHDNPKLALDLP